MRRRQSGFTLIEVVIALAILAVAFFGMISVITYTTRMNMVTRERMFAMRAAEKKIEQMLNCASFDDLDTFRTQVEGLGWEQVFETNIAGINQQALLPFRPLPAFTLQTGYSYPNPPDPPAVLFVRFPLNGAGNSITQTGTAQFADNYTLTVPTDPNSKVYADLDLDGDSATTGDLNITQCKILPVLIEVYWKGTVSSGRGGFSYLSYRYTFFRKN